MQDSYNNVTEAPQTMDEILHPGEDRKTYDPDFPNAPREWQQDTAEQLATAEGISLNGEHWEVISALHDYYAQHKDGRINARELHDALDELFHQRGGIKYLYTMFPKGPVAQGCRLAGLQAPAGAAEPGMGSAI